MSGIILPDRWRRQPTGALSLDSKNPIASGCVFLLEPPIFPKMAYTDVSGRAGKATHEYTDTTYNRAITRVSPQFGVIRGIGSSEPSTEILFPSSALNSLFSASGAASFFGLMMSIAQDSIGNHSGFLLGNGGLYEHYPFIDGKVYGNAFTATRWIDGVTPPVPITEPHSVAYTSRSGAQKAYINAVEIASGSVASTPNIGTGRFGSGRSGVISGWFFYAAFWDRILSAAEIAELNRNPWALFRKSPRIIYFPSAGGGGATLTADSGTYALTGTAATLKADRKLAADSGSYAITGTDVSLKLGRKLTAESGTYTVNGTAVSLTVGRKLTADSGTYSLTGTDVTLTYSPAGGYTLALDSGSYTLTGTAATLKVARTLAADSGTYALTGTDVTLTRGFRITADSGTYTLTGSNVAFARTYCLPADSGTYTLSGSPVSLSWSGEVIPEAPTHGGPSIYGKAVFREAEFKREYEREVSRIENERIRAIQMREDEEIVIIMAALAA
jgi:hypothetical protein